MKLFINLLLLSGLFMIAGCYKRHLEPLEPTVIDKVCTEAFGPFYDAKKHARYHYVSFDGYVAAPKSAMVSNTMFVDIYQKPGREGVKVSASFSVGSGKNQVEKLKNNYKVSDLKIESNSGAEVVDGSKVTIEGEVSPGGIPGKWATGCYVRVVKVQKAS